MELVTKLIPSGFTDTTIKRRNQKMKHTAILAERAALRTEIENEMIEYTGEVAPYSYTGKLAISGKYLWQEIQLSDGTTMWATLRDNGTGHVTLDLDEAADID